jgi:hypothetical protein
MAAFMPGASPPLVRMPIRRILSGIGFSSILSISGIAALKSKTLPRLVYYTRRKNSNSAQIQQKSAKTQERSKTPAILIDILLYKWRKDRPISVAISQERCTLQGKMRRLMRTKNTRIGRKYMIIYRFTINPCEFKTAYAPHAKLQGL